MPPSRPRVQVSIDADLASLLNELDPAPSSRSRQIRDLAMEGAHLRKAEGKRREDALELLRRIAHGETEYDPASALAVHAERELDGG